ncbi:MAG: hypothetical protein ABR575_10440 [Actinomycetota bacterium]
MLKRIVLVLLGAAGALEGEALARRLKTRYRPSAVTGTLLDKLNHSLEAKRAGEGSGSRLP